MGANDDDDSSLWNDKLLQTLKAEHDRLFHDLRTETTRLERDFNTAAGSSAGPFSAFKKIIDNGISSITTALHPRPSHSAELDVKSRMQRAQDRQRAEEQDISQRWTGSTDSPDHIQLQNSRRSAQEKEEAIDAAAELLEMAQMRNSDVPTEMVEALYRDPETNVLDVDILSGITSFHPHWLSVNWFKRSCYSPIRLEAHPQLGEHGAKWRAAFEDLLNASLDKPMGPSIERVGMRVPHGRPQSTFTGPGLEWMLSLQCRGILPMQLPRTYNHVHAVRELRHSFVTDLLEQRNLFSNHTRPASSNDSPLAADFRDLVSEVGTKATADTEAEPLPVRFYPATEQDLYESSYLCPVNHEGRRKSDGQGWPSQANTPDENEASDAHKVSGDDRAKGNMAYENEDGLQRADQLQSGNQPDLYHPERLALFRRLYALTGNEFFDEQQGFVPLAKLREMVGRLQQEHENLEKMTGHNMSTTRGDSQHQSSPDLPSRDTESAQETTSNYNNLQKQVMMMLLEKQNDWRLSGAREEQSERALIKNPESESYPTGETMSKKPDIISTLTTTQTTRLPDGTVTTKVVLKQRFVDGREETTESFHTRNEAHSDEAPQRDDKSQRDEKSTTKRGWFWS